MTFDVATIKADFPLLSRVIDGKPITYLDSAASSQRPQSVLDAMDRYYRESHANVHRGAYRLATEATDAMEGARQKIADFIGAPHAHEVIFTKNATESMNLFAQSWGRGHLHAGDVVVLTEMEHHANIVPWHMLTESIGIELRWIPVDENGELDLTDLDRLLDGAKLLSVTAMSNVLGTITPIKRLADAAHAAGATIVVDGSQYVPHLPTDVVDLGIDAFVFTGHKMLGPTGVGVLWGKTELLDAMPPFLGGGDMILQVTKDGFTTNELPHKFEAGTPAIAEIVGLGAAVDYLTALGMEDVRAHEVSLTAYAMRSLKERFGDDITIHGPSEPASRGGVLSLIYKDVHPHDISQVLDQDNVYVRAGHHCAKPLMQVMGLNATARASLYLYNDEADVDTLADALASADDIFGF
ncbi:MAG: SufS family cysteine desulfurase [Acidimicrobiales bacterium]|nr:SufS family cysteine desulfurase [Acidimicrobiales bacterium]RZV45635.1 MAG: SufS family cysteine desulfurase [Acidimicrobiales bacterium]